MKVARLWTTPTDPYPGIEFVDRPVTLTGPNTPKSVTAPAGWGQTAVDIVATKHLRRAGVPRWTRRVAEPHVPEFLQRSEPDPGTAFGGEGDARQAFDRLAGCWAYWMWKLGYFHRTAGGRCGDGEAEGYARAYLDEVRYGLAAQAFAPASPQWFNTGLHWAYGITGPDAGQFAVSHDPAAGRAGFPHVVPTRVAYERPAAHACFILGVKDDLLGPGGIYDTLTAEARVFKFGGGCGSNFSALRGDREPLSRGGLASGPLSFLGTNDAGAGAIKSAGVTRRAAKMVILDDDHPDIERFVRWKAEEEYRVACTVAGDKLIRARGGLYRDHGRAAADRAAARGPLDFAGPADSGAVVAEEFSARMMESVDLTIMAPDGDMIPAGLRNRLRLAGAQGTDPVWPEAEYDTHFEGRYSAYAGAGGQNANNSVRVSNKFLAAVDAGEDWELIRRTDGGVSKTIKAADLWALMARAAWTSADPGVQFGDIINDWNPCPADGPIRASNPCSEYHFHDDTACNLASLRLTFFAETTARGAVTGFDLAAYRHACRLLTMTLDVTIDMAGYPTAAVAEGSRKFRTLGLGYADLGAFLMRAGVPYDSDAGRAWCAALTSLMHSAATATSADMAAALGAFPRHDANRDAVRRVTHNHAAFAFRLAGADAPPEDVAAAVRYDGLSVVPPDFDGNLLPPHVRRAVRDWALEAEEGVADCGLRNAQLTLLAPTGTIGLLMGCDTTGIEPDFALVKFKKLVGGGYINTVNSSLPAALAALGYTADEARDVERYVLGTREIPSLADAPAGAWFTRVALANVGLTEADVAGAERAAKAAQNLSAAFRQGVPVERWEALLGGPVRETFAEDPDFCPLTRLLVQHGWDEDAAVGAVAEASAEVCGRGTVEYAPHLKADHYPVFDCALRCGEGTRELSPDSHVWMMAAASPALSGGISKTINMPADSTAADIARVYRLTHSLMVKCSAVYPDGAKLSQPLAAAKSARRRAQPVAAAPAAPLSAAFRAAAEVEAATPVTVGGGMPHPGRRKLPDRRPGITQKIVIRGHTFYLRTGEYPDGTLGEIFIDTAMEGSAFKAIASALAVAVSLGLQHGVPLEEFVDAYVGSRFEPDGMVTGHARIKVASSFLDAIFRDLAVSYLGRDELAHVQAEAEPPPVNQAAVASAPGAAVVESIVGPTPAGPMEQYMTGKARATAATDWDAYRRDLSARQGAYPAAAPRVKPSGGLCPKCKEFAVRRTGACETCGNCGYNTGCG